MLSTELRVKALELAIEHQKMKHPQSRILDVASLFYTYLTNDDSTVWQEQQSSMLKKYEEEILQAQKESIAQREKSFWEVEDFFNLLPKAN